MKLLLLVFITIFLAVTLADKQFSYKGYKVWLVTATNEEQRLALKQWERDDGIDFWEHVSTSNKPIRVMIAPRCQASFQQFLNEFSIEHKVIIEDAQRSFETERRENEKSRIRFEQLKQNSSSIPRADFNHFWSFTEINDYLTYLVTYFGPICSTETVGFSYEGLAIRVLKISAKGNGQIDGSRPTVFIDAGVHAREWVAPAVALYLMYQLVEHSEQYANILNNVDFIILPVVNPDGYEYSRISNRLWRKTRSHIAGSACIGVDGNRNYAYMFQFTNNPCSDTYPGLAPFTETESAIVGRILQNYAYAIKLYGSLHSYGEYFLWPWGYDFIRIENWQDHDEIGQRFAAGVSAVSGRNYSVGNSAELLYTAPGASDDYAAFEGSEIAFTLELPGGGSNGFDLPVSALQEVVSETWSGFEQIFEYVASKNWD